MYAVTKEEALKLARQELASAGGKARAAALTPERRLEIATNASRAASRAARAKRKVKP